MTPTPPVLPTLLLYALSQTYLRSQRADGFQDNGELIFQRLPTQYWHAADTQQTLAQISCSHGGWKDGRSGLLLPLFFLEAGSLGLRPLSVLLLPPLLLLSDSHCRLPGDFLPNTTAYAV